jgi:hypothetical protein
MKTITLATRQQPRATLAHVDQAQASIFGCLDCMCWFGTTITERRWMVRDPEINLVC